MPELLWKAYVDFEIEEGERELARALYDQLVGLSGHVKPERRNGRMGIMEAMSLSLCLVMQPLRDRCLRI